MRVIRLYIRTFFILLSSLILIPSYVLSSLVTGGMHWGIQRLWFRSMCRLLGMRIIVHGAPSQARPTLFVCNHVSYLDIVALGKLIDAVFVSKQEVAGWPVLGRLAKLRRSVFIDRAKIHQSPQHCREMAARIRDDNLIFFPEGTSTDGADVHPFKSTLFCVAMDGKRQAIPVQPIAITYLRDPQGKPLDGDRVDLYAWYADMTLGPHLLEVLKQPGVEIHVRFLDPIPPDTFNDRKRLSAHANEQVAEAVRRSWGLVEYSRPTTAFRSQTENPIKGHRIPESITID